MRTINSDFIRSYDRVKDDIFHAKKQEYKNTLRNKAKTLQAPKLNKIFPWRTLGKLTTLAGIVYACYNYTDMVVDYAIKKNYLTMIDIISLKVIKEDALVKLRTLIKNPTQLKNVSHFSNYLFKSQLEQDFNCLKRTYPTHKLRGTLQSRVKLWIFSFKNYEKSQYVNEFGDVIEREENSWLRIWRYPVFKSRKQKVIKEEKLHQNYRTLLEGSMDKFSDHGVIQSEIKSRCERINILNRLSSDYEQLLVQCRKNEFIGESLTQLIESRKKLYPYPKLNVEYKPQSSSQPKSEQKQNSSE